MSAENNNTKTYMDDRESLHALIECMPIKERDEYKSYKSLCFESGFPNRKMVLYTTNGGQPTDIVIITLGGFSMNSFKGPKIEVSTNVNADLYAIEMVPRRLLNRDIFLHIPQNFELKWKGKRVNEPSENVQFMPHYAILIKSKSKPQINIDGDTYCVRLNDFQKSFPYLNTRY